MLKKMPVPISGAMLSRMPCDDSDGANHTATPCEPARSFALARHHLAFAVRVAAPLCQQETRESMAPHITRRTSDFLCLISRCMLAALFLAVGTGPAHAALDPETKTPYQLQVVLHVAENRFLTPLFQDQLERDLRVHLQQSFGKLAQVEIVRQHPLLSEILAKGLEQALDGWDALSDRKTHFVLLDFGEGRYQLEARQYDGMSGLASPVTRRAHTFDRRQVADLAARLVEQDFGVVGTVVRAAGEDVELALKGGALGEPLGRWVEAGDLFAIARLTREGGKLRAARLPWALLQAVNEPQEGIVRCRFLHRFAEDNLAESPGVEGYRCLRLNTTTAPVRLRFVEPETFRPLVGLQVHIRGGREQKPREYATNQDGVIVTSEPFRHLALVQVIHGGGPIAQFPVEIVRERTLVCHLKISAEAEAQAPLDYRKDQWLRRLGDNLRVAAERVGDLNALLTRSLDSALDAGRAGLKTLDHEIAELTLERGGIVRQAADKKVPLDRLDLRDGDQALERLHERRAELAGFIARLEKTIADAASPQTQALVKILERARLLEGEAEYDQAIQLYEKVLADSPNQPKGAQHLAKLKRAWAIKSAEHDQARRFIYQTWPRVEPGELKSRLAQGRQALQTCQAAGDAMSLQRLLSANVVHAGSLKKRLDVLKRQEGDDSRAEARTLAQVADALRQLHAEATAFVRAENEKVKR